MIAMPSREAVNRDATIALLDRIGLRS